MQLLALLFLLSIHFFTGNGLLYAMNIPVTGVKRIALSLITGISIASWLPFLLQLIYLPITLSSVVFILCVALLVCNLRNLRDKKIGFGKISFPKIALYEWPFFIVFFLLFAITAMRGYYVPVQARDMLAGPEAIAEFTVREHTMINSVFSINLQSTNNPFKSTYITSMQVIYKLFGFESGQVWHVVLAWSFIAFVYCLLRERVHKLLAAMLLLFFILIPELFGYTYMILYDYSNMAFFFLGAYFILRYCQSLRNNTFALAAFFVGMAMYTRQETLILVGMFLPFFFFILWKVKKQSLWFAAMKSAVILFTAVFVYVLCIVVYNGHYLPVTYDIGGQVADLSRVDLFFKRFTDMNSQLIFEPVATAYWGIFMYFFCALLLIDLIVNRSVNKEGRFWLLFVLIIYIGLPVIGYLLPLADLMNTTKRGLFKLFPFMILYLSDTTLLKRLSDRITKWQYA